MFDYLKKIIFFSVVVGLCFIPSVCATHSAEFIAVTKGFLNSFEQRLKGVWCREEFSLTVEQFDSFDHVICSIEALCKSVSDKKIKDLSPGPEFVRQTVALKKIFKDMRDRRAGDLDRIEKVIQAFRCSLEREVLKRVPKKDPQKESWNTYIRDLQARLEGFCDLLIAVEKDADGYVDAGGGAADGGGEAGAADAVEAVDELSMSGCGSSNVVAPLYDLDVLTERTRVCLESLENFFKKIAIEMLREKHLRLARFEELEKIKNWAQKLSLILGNHKRWVEGYDRGVMEYFTGFTSDTRALEDIKQGAGYAVFDEALSDVFELDERKYLMLLDDLERNLPAYAYVCEGCMTCEDGSEHGVLSDLLVAVQVPFLAASDAPDAVAVDSSGLLVCKKRRKKRPKGTQILLGDVLPPSPSVSSVSFSGSGFSSGDSASCAGDRRIPQSALPSRAGLSFLFDRKDTCDDESSSSDEEPWDLLACSSTLLRLEDIDSEFACRAKQVLLRRNVGQTFKMLKEACKLLAPDTSMYGFLRSPRRACVWHAGKKIVCALIVCLLELDEAPSCSKECMTVLGRVFPAAQENKSGILSYLKTQAAGVEVNFVTYDFSCLVETS